MWLTKPISKNIIWYSLLTIGLTGIIMMIVGTFVYPSDLRYINSKGEIIGQMWYSNLILWFYFTFISNVMGFLMALFWIFKLIKNERIQKFWQNLATVNLTITLIVYWAALFPLGQPTNVFNWFSNMFVHLVVPILAILAFIVENVLSKNNIQFHLWKTAGWSMLFPLGWLAIAVIIYVSLNCDTGAAIYPFLDFAHNPVWMSCLFLIGIGLAYFWITVLYIYLANPNKNKKIKNSK